MDVTASHHYLFLAFREDQPNLTPNEFLSMLYGETIRRIFSFLSDSGPDILEFYGSRSSPPIAFAKAWRWLAAKWSSWFPAETSSFLGRIGERLAAAAKAAWSWIALYSWYIAVAIIVVVIAVIAWRIYKNCQAEARRAEAPMS